MTYLDELTPTVAPDLAARLLAFEAAHPDRHGSKEEIIRRELGMKPARYYQLLSRLIDTEDALRIDPQNTHRLRRLRDRDENTRRARLGLPTTPTT